MSIICKNTNASATPEFVFLMPIPGLDLKVCKIHNTDSGDYYCEDDKCSAYFYDSSTERTCTVFTHLLNVGGTGLKSTQYKGCWNGECYKADLFPVLLVILESRKSLTLIYSGDSTALCEFLIHLMLRPEQDSCIMEPMALFTENNSVTHALVGSSKSLTGAIKVSWAQLDALQDTGKCPKCTKSGNHSPYCAKQIPVVSAHGTLYKIESEEVQVCMIYRGLKNSQMSDIGVNGVLVYRPVDECLFIIAPTSASLASFCVDYCLDELRYIKADDERVECPGIEVYMKRFGISDADRAAELNRLFNLFNVSSEIELEKWIGLLLGT